MARSSGGPYPRRVGGVAGILPPRRHRRVSREAAETARRILYLCEQHRSAITAGLGRAAGNGYKVLESLFDRPIIAVNDVRTLTGTTYAAANTLVSRMVELGILHEMTGYARNRRFRYDPYIALFADAPQPETPA